ncbi:MAG: hypothetical protein R3C01_16765 [Planctomycetaceae bacterium]
MNIGGEEKRLSSIDGGLGNWEAFAPPLIAEEITVSFRIDGSDELHMKTFPYRSEVPDPNIRHLVIKIVFTDDDVFLTLSES